MGAKVTIDARWMAGGIGCISKCLLPPCAGQVSVASERKNYADNLAALQFGVTRLILEHPERLEAKAPERAARACFLSAIGKFISFLDKLIASQRVSKDGISINRNLSIDDLQNYVNEYMEERVDSLLIVKGNLGLRAYDLRVGLC